MAIEDIKFFADSDRRDGRPDGDVVSSFPGWYFDRSLTQLKVVRDKMEREMKDGFTPPNVLESNRVELSRLNKRIEDIERSIPKLSGKDKDELVKVHKALGEKISETMFTEYDMKKGFADAHEEARRMKEDVIDVGKEYEGILRQMNINPRKPHPNTHKRMCGRDEVSRAYKTIGALLGENTNIEKLRKTEGQNSRKIM